MSETHRRARIEQADERAGVTALELFFDLVFVFAVTQLSHLLLYHFSLTGAFDAYLAMIGDIAAAYDQFLDFSFPSPLTASAGPVRLNAPAATS